MVACFASGRTTSWPSISPREASSVRSYNLPGSTDRPWCSCLSYGPGCYGADSAGPCSGSRSARSGIFLRALLGDVKSVASMRTVESTPETVRSGYLDPAAKPVAVIQPGDTVRYPNTWTHWDNEAKFGMSFADREPLRHRYPHGPYSMLGPVEVTGAVPGDVIEVSITALRTIGWGWNSFPLGVGA